MPGTSLSQLAGHPAVIPGHEAGSGHHHIKHGVAAFFVGVALLVFAWFQTGKNKNATTPADE